MATYKQYRIKKGAFWEVRGYLGIDRLTGKEIETRKRGFNTKKEAQRYYNNAKLQFENNQYSIKKVPNITFAEVYRDWLEVYAKGIEKSTLAKITNIFRIHILPVFGDKIIKHITSKSFQQAVNEWHNYSASYRRFYNYCCKVFDHAVAYEYIETNPKTKVILPKAQLHKPKKVTADYYSKEELEQFLSYAEQDAKKIGHSTWYTFFRLISFTGLRRGEALALTWNDIDFNEGTLSVNKAVKREKNNRLYIGTPKTKGSIRVVSIDQKTMAILRKWKIEQARLLLGFGYSVTSANQLVFSNSKNGIYTVNSPNNRLEAICKKFDFKQINLHGFRHTHCSLLFEAGVPMKDVKERLGHADIQTTMNIYTHVTEASRDKSAQLFAKYANF